MTTSVVSDKDLSEKSPKGDHHGSRVTNHRRAQPYGAPRAALKEDLLGDTISP